MGPIEWMCILAGLGLGWILRDLLGKKKLDPNIMMGAQQIIEKARDDFEKNLNYERRQREEERLAAQRLIQSVRAPQVATWPQSPSVPVQQEITGYEAPQPPSQPRMAEPREVEDNLRLAVQEMPRGDLNEAVKYLQGQFDLPAVEARAILEGRWEEIEKSESLDSIVSELLQGETGTV